MLLSGLPGNPHNQNMFSGTEPSSSDASDETARPVETVDQDTPGISEAPLPRFNEEPEADQETKPVRSSAAFAPDLADFLAEQRPDDSEESEQAAGHPIYRVTSAEPDWSEYTVPSPDEPSPEEENESGWKTAWAVLREVGETILLTLIIFLLIQTVIRNFRVVGTSMVDNLHNGQYLIIDKLSYTELIWKNLGMGGPQRGDVVVFEPPNRPGEDYVKRIIGLPGETIEIKNGQVFVNGEPLDEPFQPVAGTYTMPRAVTVPLEQVFVLGDNRNNSNDSHNWGTLPVENIVGRAWLSYWPPDAWGVIPRDAPTEQATLRQLLEDLVPGASADSE